MVGTQGYIAPESMGDKPVYSSKSDMYSLGCLLYTLCRCKPLPSLGLPGSTIPPIQAHFPQRLQPVISKCVNSDPTDRPTGREVVNDLSETYVDILSSNLWRNTKDVLEASVLNTIGKYSGAISPCSPPSEKSIENGARSTPERITPPRHKRTGKLRATLDPGQESRCVKKVLFSPDSSLLVSLSIDSTVRIWNVATAKLSKALKGHSDMVTGASFSPDGHTLVSGSLDDTIKLWKIATGYNYKTLLAKSGYVNQSHFRWMDPC